MSLNPIFGQIFLVILLFYVLFLLWFDLKKDPPPSSFHGSWNTLPTHSHYYKATLKLGTQECILNENDRKASKAILWMKAIERLVKIHNLENKRYEQNSIYNENITSKNRT